MYLKAVPIVVQNGIDASLESRGGMLGTEHPHGHPYLKHHKSMHDSFALADVVGMRMRSEGTVNGLYTYLLPVGDHISSVMTRHVD